MSETVYPNLVQHVAFHGASTAYKMELKGLLEGDPDSLTVNELALLQKRSQDQIRNNGYAKTARNKYVQNLGAITVNWKHKVKDKVQKHKLMQELWDEFCKDPNLDGYGTLANTQSLWHSEVFANGAAFTRQLIVKTNNKNRVPLKLQVIPATMHDTFYAGKSTADNVRYGIKFKKGQRFSYFFREELLDILEGKDNYSFTRQPVEIPAQEITHHFIREYAGQWLGIPALASVLIPLYDIDELIDATVAKQKAAQAISWIIENAGINPSPIGSVNAEKGKEGEEKIVFRANGTSVQYANKGERVRFYQSTDIGPNLPVLIQSELRRIAASVGVPYHSLTGDAGELNFSSLRSIAVELRQNLEYINNFYTIPLSLEPIARRFKELASLKFQVKDSYPTFRLPIWRGVDDLKDGQSDVLEINGGIGAIQKILGERDLTIEDVLESAEYVKQIEEALGRPLAGSNTNQVVNTEANINSTTN